MEIAMFRRTTCLLGLAALSAILLAPQAQASGTAHQFTFEAIEGGDLPLSKFSGQPVLVVNTASMCGFTRQYDGLQEVYDRYRDRGLVVLGVPSDDFGGQEYATEAEVKEFCEVNFNLDFPMTSITHVKGKSRHPFYTWAEAELGRSNAPRWNFHKYLIGPDGRAVAAFGTRTRPTAPQVTSAIEALLN